MSDINSESWSPPTTPQRCTGMHSMPLPLAAVGQEVQFVAADGGRALQHRLAELGLSPGARFRVLAKGNPGPFIVCVKDTRLVLGRGMVSRIRVAP